MTLRSSLVCTQEALEDIGFTCDDPLDSERMHDAGSFTHVNCRLESLVGRPGPRKADRRRRRKAVYKSTMQDMERVGSISLIWWVVRPVFMWALRRLILMLIDRYFSDQVEAGHDSD